MNYADLLNKYIAESGLTLAEIAEKMKEKGQSIDRSYISMLKNNKTKNPASDEINRALAEVTGGDPDELVLAAFYDKAPSEVKISMNTSKSFKHYLGELINLTSEKKLTPEEFEEHWAYLKSLPEEEYVAELTNILFDLMDSPPEVLLEGYKAVQKAIGAEEDIKKLSRLKELRESKKISTHEMSLLLGIDEKLYKDVELIGRIKFSGESKKKEYFSNLNKLYKKSIDVLHNHDEKSGVEEDTNSLSINELDQFDKFINDPQHGIFFRDYLEAPEERKRELMQFWRFIQEKEKDRNPGDHQEE
ncbi:Helix-turn-helix domain protein [compost metagenome]